MPDNAAPTTGENILLFNGESTRVTIVSRPQYSLAPHHRLTISAWIRPDTVEFPNAEGSNYVHWLSKGSPGKHEWVFRMYSYTTTDPCPRPNRISFYVFNPAGGEGTGSYAQDRVERGEWIHIAAIADIGCTHFFKNGVFRECDIYRDSESDNCVHHVGRPCDEGSDPVVPMADGAPLRIGSRSSGSWFLGAIARVRIWDRILSDEEIEAMYLSEDAVPREHLVAEFLLNEGSGAEARDGSDLANHGTIVNGSWATA